MRFKYIRAGRTVRVYVAEVDGFNECRVWIERADDGGCRLHCPIPPPGHFRSQAEIADELVAKLLREGYDIAMMDFDELLGLSIRPIGKLQ